MGKFKSRDPVRLEQFGKPHNEIENVRHMRQDVIGDRQIGRHSLSGQIPTRSPAEIVDMGGDSLRDRGQGNVGGRLDSLDRNSGFHEVLQKIAVIASDFDNLRLRVQIEAGPHGLGIKLRMSYPTVGIRRIVNIIGVEDLVVSHHFIGLDQKAIGAYPNDQRKDAVAPAADVLGPQEGVG